ncbi:LysE family transporter [Pelomonas sp. APW6]|uniref:LysE family transporter n=1 Tax=Roseateles subflavus TaxID=3053353 RepID=A0ABT7LC75_9BURK|nr:LysE family transporter [Pelomonas sp. APW6]MDL5030468.1 LysE family transporter [Pelomonas sp. APW6]
MTSMAVYLQGLVLVAGLIVAIGAQNAFVLRQGLLRRHVGLVVLFCALADALLMAVGIWGLGALDARLPGVTQALRWAGIAFLLAYGLRALARVARPAGLEAGGGGGGGASAAGTLAQAAAFTLLNPHVYLDTVLLVGAIGTAQAPAQRPLFFLGAVSCSLLWFAGLGYGARLLAPLFARQRAWQVLDLLLGLMMLALAWGLWRGGV